MKSRLGGSGCDHPPPGAHPAGLFCSPTAHRGNGPAPTSDGAQTAPQGAAPPRAGRLLLQTFRTVGHKSGRLDVWPAWCLTEWFRCPRMARRLWPNGPPSPVFRRHSWCSFVYFRAVREGPPLPVRVSVPTRQGPAPSHAGVDQPPLAACAEGALRRTQGSPGGVTVRDRRAGYRQQISTRTLPSRSGRCLTEVFAGVGTSEPTRIGGMHHAVWFDWHRDQCQYH